MKNTVVDFYRQRKESIYGIILSTLGGLGWLLFFVFGLKRGWFSSPSDIALFFVILFFIVISALLFRAQAMGNMILISEEQFPELHKMVIDGAKELNISPPEAFLYNANGIFNAFARKIFGRKYLLLTSSLVDATTDEQVKFVIGHELGHHAAGHLHFFLYLLKLPAVYILNPLYLAYSRQREYTCDNIGLHLSRDDTHSCTAIQMLGCGCQRLNSKLNVNAFAKQEQLVPAISGYISEIFRTHPRLTRRVIALKNRKLLPLSQQG